MKKILLGTLLIAGIGFAQAQKTKPTGFPLSSSLASGQHVFVSGQIGMNPQTSKLANESFEAEVRHTNYSNNILSLTK
ncbi:hypothetical protein ACTS91_14300 [Empedobacter falsenii]|uniref:RidA family protein n=1 Tax=Empedobacter falsenii TaxID=343874 RepID=A0A376GKH0_9FLAO|nr:MULTISPECIES: hypothetical protein [Empedobacter]MDH1881126.1 RidA family protein [Empedobacter sp. GD03797]MDM1040002.1 hypothetical protein [Empedobacter brevis]MDM1133934.1 hypothetical protein [Empedobacter sp. R750]STD58887.1 Uncharacterised protein [Empedobacter falsenii]